MGFAAGIFAFLVKIGFGSIAEKGIQAVERRAELEADREAVRMKTTAELAREAVAETKVMAEFNTAKLGMWPFWLLIFLVSAPFIAWEWAVVIDSVPIFRDVFGEQQVADLPTPELQDAFAAMVQWVFFVGTGGGSIVAVARAMRR